MARGNASSVLVLPILISSALFISFPAGYSADSDYHSEYGFPLQQQNCVDPNAPTSQFLQPAANAALPPDQAMVSPFNAQPQQQYFDPGGGGAGGGAVLPPLQQDFYNQQQQVLKIISFAPILD